MAGKKGCGGRPNLTPGERRVYNKEVWRAATEAGIKIKREPYHNWYAYDQTTKVWQPIGLTNNVAIKYLNASKKMAG